MHTDHIWKSEVGCVVFYIESQTLPPQNSLHIIEYTPLFSIDSVFFILNNADYQYQVGLSSEDILDTITDFVTTQGTKWSTFYYWFFYTE